MVTALPRVMLSRLGDDLRIVMATSSATLVTSCPFTWGGWSTFYQEGLLLTL